MKEMLASLLRFVRDEFRAFLEGQNPLPGIDDWLFPCNLAGHYSKSERIKIVQFLRSRNPIVPFEEMRDIFEISPRIAEIAMETHGVSRREIGGLAKKRKLNRRKIVKAMTLATQEKMK